MFCPLRLLKRHGKITTVHRPAKISGFTNAYPENFIEGGIGEIYIVFLRQVVRIGFENLTIER